MLRDARSRGFRGVVACAMLEFDSVIKQSENVDNLLPAWITNVLHMLVSRVLHIASAQPSPCRKYILVRNLL